MNAQAVFVAVLFCLAAFVSCDEQKLVYGNDDRTEPYAISSSTIQSYIQADVAIMYSWQLSKKSGKYKLTEYSSYDGVRCPSSYVEFCDTEPFKGQIEAAFCSGFLIVNNDNSSRIVTAGHCLSGMDCGSMAFVFDFKMSTSTSIDTEFPSSNVYFCDSYYFELDDSTNMDFGVVELDRKVSGRTALSYRTSGTVTSGTPLVMVGHPTGIPMKVDDGAVVKSVSGVRFSANTDSYAGNSGSMIINANTGQVEGILVEGNQDFEIAGGCCVSNVCSDSTGCSGSFEIVSKIDQASPYFYTTLPYAAAWSMQPIMMLVVVLALFTL